MHTTTTAPALDPAKLDKVKPSANGKMIAACPACREIGRDKSGNHLCIEADGRFGCAAFPGDGEHRKRIFALAGVKGEAPAAPPRAKPQTWPGLQAAAEAVTPPRHRLAAVYPYGGGAGVARYEADTGKTFRQFHKTGEGWRIGGPAGLWPLFGTVPAAGPVFIVEGEKAQQAAESIGLPAVTSAGGSNAAAKADWTPLAGREVVILPDADAPGRAYADAVAVKLAHLDPPASVKTLDLPGLPEGGDIADWIEQRDAIEPDALRAEVERMANDAQDETAKAIKGLPGIDAATYIETEPPPHDPIIENIFDMGDKAELIGGSKQKKSLTTIELSLHVATGRNWLGLKIPKRRRVLYVNLELRDGWIWRRIRRACRAHGIEADELRGWLTVVNARSRGEIIRHHLVELAAREDAELVVVDPRYKLQLPGESENAGEGIGEILNLFDRVAEDGRALLVVHHDPKGDGGDKAIADRGGGSGWAGRDVDARLCLTPQKQEPDGASVVSIMARNYPPTPDFCIRWGDHRFELAPELMPAPFTSWDRRRMLGGSGGAASKAAEDYNAVALDAAEKPQSRNEILCRLQKAGASRDLARACLDALVADGKIAHTPRTGKKGGAVRYGTPSAIETLMNPPLIGAKSK